MNVVPNEFTIGFDIRITPTTKLANFEAMIRKWIGEAGGNFFQVILIRCVLETYASLCELRAYSHGYFKNETRLHHCGREQYCSIFAKVVMISINI